MSNCLLIAIRNCDRKLRTKFGGRRMRKNEGEEEEENLLALYLREKVPRGVPSQRYTL